MDRLTDSGKRMGGNPTSNTMWSLDRAGNVSDADISDDGARLVGEAGGQPKKTARTMIEKVL